MHNTIMPICFFYSERPGTLAAKRFTDDVPEAVKKRRLQEIINLQNELSKKSYMNDMGKSFEVLIEGESKKDNLYWKGRNPQNKMLVFPKKQFNYKPGDYVNVLVHDATQATLLGEIIPA